MSLEAAAPCRLPNRLPRRRRQPVGSSGTDKEGAVGHSLLMVVHWLTNSIVNYGQNKHFKGESNQNLYLYLIFVFITDVVGADKTTKIVSSY